MKVIAKQNRDLVMINAQNTQNENDAEKILLQVPEKYEDFNKKIVFITPDGNVWDIITNNEYLIKKAITKYNQVDFYIWLTKDDVDFRSQTKTLKFYHNVDASDEITDEEIGRVNTIVNILEEEIDKVENLNITAQKIGNTTTVTITKKDGTTESVEINDGVDGQNGQDGQDGISPTITETQTANGYDITITDKSGSNTISLVNGKDGKDGINGQDGAKGEKRRSRSKRRTR